MPCSQLHDESMHVDVALGAEEETAAVIESELLTIVHRHSATEADR